MQYKMGMYFASLLIGINALKSLNIINVDLYSFHFLND